MGRSDRARTEANAAALEQEVAWFEALLDRRFRVYGGGEDQTPDIFAAGPTPALGEGGYSDAVRAAGLGAEERAAAMLALLPWLLPAALDPFLLQNEATGRQFSEFGGAPAEGRPGFRPTVATALFLLAGASIPGLLGALRLFAPDAPLLAGRILRPLSDPVEPWQPLEPHPDFLRAARGC